MNNQTILQDRLHKESRRCFWMAWDTRQWKT